VFVGALFIKGRNKNKSATTVVGKGQIKEELILTGSVRADKHAVLYFPTGGKIAWVSVKEGDWVKKGQALTSLDKTILNSVYMQASNTYRNYQAAAESALDSVKNHASDETFTQKATRTAAESARDSAYDALRAAQYNLANATLYAPFDGLVTSLPFPNPGVNVNLTDAQVEILDPASIYFEVEADQNEVTSIKEKMPVTIILDSYRDKQITGTVSFISYSPKSGEASIIYKVKVGLDKNSLGDFSPRIGMSGDANFIISEKSDAIIVPTRFVNTDKDGKYVNLGKKGNKVRVETGIEGEENIEIVSGAKEGDVLFD
jgi:macrolide-specific efflux system membrane fusion protein